MSELKDQLVAQFKEANAAPFLFIGSGFSRRYLGLENWPELLKRFCNDLRPFEYYLATANGELPKVASLIAEDFHHYWWESEKYKDQREKHKSKLKDRTSALRIEICEYLNAISIVPVDESPYATEIEVLSRLNVDGIITTNWDGFLEKLFPDYRVFIGQNELLFSNPQSIAEIYKIHGSSTKPSTIVLTDEDYINFEKINPYLAAKLITLFVEHPIVFIGYSITDRNIAKLLGSIVSCLGDENLEKLRNNLIFVQRSKDGSSGLSQTYLTIEGKQLPITIAKSDSFIPIYEALDETKRKIPARVLRYCKEQLYELVRSETPESKLYVVDIDEIDKTSDIEFVVGVGVAEKQTASLSHLGYQGLTALDLFNDIVNLGTDLDPAQIIEKTIPELSKNCTYLPVYKYLKALGIDDAEAYKASGFDLGKVISPDSSHFRSTIYARAFVRDEKEKTCAQIISTNTAVKAAIYLSFVNPDGFDTEEVRKFLSKNADKFDSSVSNYSTYFRKLACMLDWVEFGWKQEQA